MIEIPEEIMPLMISLQFVYCLEIQGFNESQTINDSNYAVSSKLYNLLKTQQPLLASGYSCLVKGIYCKFSQFLGTLTLLYLNLVIFIN